MHRWLVEDEYARVGEQRSSQCEALSLPTRQLAAVDPDGRVEAQRLTFYPVEQMHRGGRGGEFGVRGVRLGEQKICADRRVEDMGVGERACDRCTNLVGG